MLSMDIFEVLGEYIAVEGEFVRHEKDSAASVKLGDVRGIGRRDMKTPGGNDGARMRIYHPRFGL